MKTFDLINIGRNKVCRRVEVTDEYDLLREVRKHLASRGVDIAWNEETGIGTVCAGFHALGIVREVVEPHA